MSEKRRLYLSGSITGSFATAKRTFNQAKENLRYAEYDVISPMDYPPASELSWVKCMQRDIGLVAKCDGIALIDTDPATQFSHGVRIEIEVAQYLHLPIMSVDSWLNTTIDRDRLYDWSNAEVASANSRRFV